MADCISRVAAWNGIYKCPTKTDADGYIWVRTKDVAHMIDDIPAADVAEVVLCKDCYAYQKHPDLAREACLNPEEYCALLGCEMPEYGFCYYGALHNKKICAATGDTTPCQPTISSAHPENENRRECVRE